MGPDGLSKQAGGLRWAVVPRYFGKRWKHLLSSNRHHSRLGDGYLLEPVCAFPPKRNDICLMKARLARSLSTAKSSSVHLIYVCRQLIQCYLNIAHCAHQCMGAPLGRDGRRLQVVYIAPSTHSPHAARAHDGVMYL